MRKTHSNPSFQAVADESRAEAFNEAQRWGYAIIENLKKEIINPDTTPARKNDCQRYIYAYRGMVKHFRRQEKKANWELEKSLTQL